MWDATSACAVEAAGGSSFLLARDPEKGRRDKLAVAERAFARLRQPVPLVEHEPAFPACCRFHMEMLVGLMQGPADMFEMTVHRPLGDPDDGRHLFRGHGVFLKERDDIFPYRIVALYRNERLSQALLSHRKIIDIRPR
jgi:hypothetical protein